MANKQLPSEICADTYIGPLCQTCNKNFARQFGSSFKCIQCYSIEFTYALIIIIIIIFTIVLALYIKYGFKNNLITYFNRLIYLANMKIIDTEFAYIKMLKAAYIKIFINYSQCISIINSLKLDWNDIFSKFFEK